MKRYINSSIWVLLFIFTLSIVSCNEDKLDETSIFVDSSKQQSNFDKWLYKNYTIPYNISLLYKLEDIESSKKYTLAPAELGKSKILSQIVKHLWLDAYNEALNPDFIRTYVPKTIHFIGSGAYENNGTVVLGTAEGGMKVTLYFVNNMKLDPAFLNHYYFKTIHHEFTHILTQTRNYSPDFGLISESDYVSGDWYQTSEANANKLGFVSPYASSEANEDFAENVSIYITNTKAYWESLLKTAGSPGAEIITQKMDMVKNYMKTAWDIDLDDLRDIIQRRTQEIFDMEYDTFE